jgi:hypothetical protein
VACSKVSMQRQTSERTVIPTQVRVVISAVAACTLRYACIAVCQGVELENQQQSALQSILPADSRFLLRRIQPAPVFRC